MGKFKAPSPSCAFACAMIALATELLHKFETNGFGPILAVALEQLLSSVLLA